MTDKLTTLKKLTGVLTAIVIILSIAMAVVCFIASQQKVTSTSYSSLGYPRTSSYTETNATMIMQGMVWLFGGIFGAAFFCVFMFSIIDCFAAINVLNSNVETINQREQTDNSTELKN